MNLQKETINHFMRHFNFPTLREVTKITGINTSRVYRILKGGEMKLTEFQTFCNKANRPFFPKTHSKELSLSSVLSTSALADIEALIEEKLKCHRFLVAGVMS